MACQPNCQLMLLIALSEFLALLKMNSPCCGLDPMYLIGDATFRTKLKALLPGCAKWMWLSIGAASDAVTGQWRQWRQLPVRMPWHDMCRSKVDSDNVMPHSEHFTSFEALCLVSQCWRKRSM